MFYENFNHPISIYMEVIFNLCLWNYQGLRINPTSVQQII